MPAEIETQVVKVLRQPGSRMMLCRLVYENKWNGERGRWEEKLLRIEEIEPCQLNGSQKRE
jgi:hypothetical protein